jgi:hypothetical protein
MVFAPGPNSIVGYALMPYFLKCPFCVYQQEISRTELLSGKSKLTPTVSEMMEHVRSAHDHEYVDPHLPIVQCSQIGVWEILKR